MSVANGQYFSLADSLKNLMAFNSNSFKRPIKIPKHYVFGIDIESKMYKEQKKALYDLQNGTIKLNQSERDTYEAIKTILKKQGDESMTPQRKGTLDLTTRQIQSIVKKGCLFKAESGKYQFQKGQEGYSLSTISNAIKRLTELKLLFKFYKKISITGNGKYFPPQKLLKSANMLDYKTIRNIKKGNITKLPAKMIQLVSPVHIKKQVYAIMTARISEKYEIKDVSNHYFFQDLGWSDYFQQKTFDKRREIRAKIKSEMIDLYKKLVCFKPSDGFDYCRIDSKGRVSSLAKNVFTKNGKLDDMNRDQLFSFMFDCLN